MGQPLEHGLRTAVMAVRIAQALGLPSDDQATVFYTGVLHFAGCTAESEIDARFFGDEMAARPRMLSVQLGTRRELMAMATRTAHPDEAPLTRAAMMARSAFGGLAEFREWAVSHCDVARLLGARMGLSEEIQRSLRHLYERWDGKGMPGELSGEQLPLAVRLMQVAQDADIAYQRGGAELAASIVARRAGSGLDPRAAAAFLAAGDEIYEGMDAPSIWDEAMAAEPGSQPVITEDRLDDCLWAVADFADLKSMWTVGHSRGVAQLAEEAAVIAGLAADDLLLLRRAALVHDIGRVAVPVSVWAKPGPLSRGERACARWLGRTSTGTPVTSRSTPTSRPSSPSPRTRARSSSTTRPTTRPARPRWTSTRRSPPTTARPRSALAGASARTTSAQPWPRPRTSCSSRWQRRARACSPRPATTARSTAWTPMGRTWSTSTTPRRSPGSPASAAPRWRATTPAPASDTGYFWCDATGAGGGGSSEFWGRPSYQHGPGVNNPNSTHQCSFAASGSPCREVPDISANADEFTPYAEYCTGTAKTVNSVCATFSGSQPVPGWFGIGGTSLSSPLWSGIAGDRDSYTGRRAGNLNPLLYQLYNSSPGVFFHDITGNGPAQAAATNNGLFPTTPGYDEATGIGTPKMAALITESS